MKVLVACEESQTVCKAFRFRGHEAYSCDIVDCSGGFPDWHIKGDALRFINGDCSFITVGGCYVEIVGAWDLIIAHPPCTYMSNAGACRMYPHKGQIDKDRYRKAMEAKEFFMHFYKVHCARVAIENPLPMKIIGLPAPTQIIQPYQFGEPYSKKTLLWLKGLAPLQPTKVLSKYTPWISSGTGGFSRGRGGSRGVARTPQLRSKTFQGIAEAMSEQWGQIGAET